MKKSVAIIAVLLMIPLLLWALKTVTITGFYDYSALPAPPSPPGQEEEIPAIPSPPETAQPAPSPSPTPSPTYRTTYSRSGAILSSASTYEYPLTQSSINQEQIIPLLYDTAKRVAILEQKLKVLELIPEFEEQLNSFSQRFNTLENKIQNLESRMRMSVEVPAFTQSIDDLKRIIKNRTIFSIILSILSLILITGLIITTIIQRKNAEKEDKETIKNYLKNYMRSGYKFETLKMHLLAGGWNEKMINDAVEELKGGRIQ